MHGTGGNRGIGDPTRGAEQEAGGRARSRASQRIVEELRQSIRQREITPGERLPAERTLCEQFGVSRVTIREALRVLEASGLVDIRLGSHGGAFVTSPTAEGAAGALEDYFTLAPVSPQEIHEVRRMLELGIVPLACERAGDDDFERLEGTYHELESAWQEGRYDPRTIRDFHVFLARAARNTAAEVLLEPLYGPVLLAAEEVARAGAQPGERDAPTGPAQPPGAGFVDSGRHGVEEHRKLLDAVRDRDAQRATAHMRALIESSTP